MSLPLCDIIRTNIANLFTGLLASVIIFGLLGFFSQAKGIEISDLEISGKELVFVTYPAALAYLPFARLWLFIFFFALILIGVDSQFALLETLCYIVIDFKPKINNKEIREEIVRLGVCGLCLILGLIFSTRKGFDYLSFVNAYVINLPLITANLANFYAFCGFKRLEE